MRTWIRDRALGLAFIALFVLSWLGQFLVQLRQVTNETKEHGKEFLWSDFWMEFWKDTLENWQSEFLQVGVFVIATAYLIYRGSAESKDSDERVEAKIDQILERLEEGKDS